MENMSKVYLGKIVEVIKDDFGNPTSEIRIRVPTIHGSSGKDGVADNKLPIARPIIFPGTIFSKRSFLNISESIKIAYVMFEAGSLTKPVYFGLRTDSAIYDVSSLTEVDFLDFTDEDAPEYKKGRLFYDVSTNFLSYYNEHEDVTVNIGNELLKPAINNTTSNILKGKVVYLSGVDEETGIFTIDLADASDESKCFPVAVTKTMIPANGGKGYIVTHGPITGINTSHLLSAKPVYLSSTSPGDLEVTPPGEEASTIIVGIAKKISAGGANDGEIEVDGYYSGIGGGNTYIYGVTIRYGDEEPSELGPGDFWFDSSG